MKEEFGMDYSSCVDKGNGSDAPFIPNVEEEDTSDGFIWTGNYHTTAQYQNLGSVEASNGQESMQPLSGKIVELEGQQVQMMRNIVQLRKELHKTMRSRLQSSTLALGQNNQYLAVKTYESGFKECTLFFLNAYGPAKIQLVSFMDKEIDEEIRCVQLKNIEQKIVFKPDKIREKDLYRLFLRSGIQMTDGIKNPEKMLFDYFACRKVEDKLELPFKVGWSKGRFFDYGNIKAFEEVYPKNAPILQKRFRKHEANRDVIASYLAELNIVSDWRDRLMLLLFPFLGMVQSIIPEWTVVPFRAINLISLKPVTIKRISKLLQVYNRERAEAVSLDDAPKKVLSVVENGKDDVILIHAGALIEDAYHGKAKPQRIISSVMNMVSDEGKACPVAVAFVTKNWIRENGVYNLILPEEFSASYTADVIQRYDGLEMLLTEFIKKVQMRFKNGALKFSGVKNVFEWLYLILEQIVSEQKLDLAKEIGLPKEIDFVSCFEKEEAKSGDLLELFVTATRRQAVKLVFQDKRSKVTSENVICYDSEELWIPQEVLSKILTAGGLNVYKHELLLAMKENGSLICENGGLTCRLQIDKVRTEFYRVRRSLFEKTGCLDIIDLGERGDAL